MMERDEFIKWYESIDGDRRSQLLSRNVGVLRFKDGTELWIEPARDPSIITDGGQSERVAAMIDDFQLGVDLGNGEVEVVRVRTKDQADAS